LYWGDEQGLYLHDSRAENYIYGRQPMTTSQAWQMHGCFKTNASQFTNMQFNELSRNGCKDDTQSKDHFDPTSNQFLHVQHMYHLRVLYPILQNGFGLETISKIPVGNGRYLWSVSRSYLPVQNQPNGFKVWFIFTNSDTPVTISNGCALPHPLHSPYLPGTTVVDIILEAGNIQVDTFATGVSCLESFSLEPFGYKAYVEEAEFIPMPSRLVEIQPKHDSRFNILEITEIDLELKFTKNIDCSTISTSLLITSYPPSLVKLEGTGSCLATEIETVWTGKIVNIEEGILEFRLTNDVQSQEENPILVFFIDVVCSWVVLPIWLPFKCIGFSKNK
jgi:alpha-1,3-glucan synthase